MSTIEEVIRKALHSKEPTFFIVNTEGRFKIARTECKVGLKLLRSWIGGGYIECVPIGGGMMVVCDEDARLKNLKANLLFPAFFGDIVLGRAEYFF